MTEEARQSDSPNDSSAETPEAPTAEERAAEAPTAEERAAEAPTAEERAAEAPTAEERAAEAPTAEERAAEARRASPWNVAILFACAAAIVIGVILIRTPTGAPVPTAPITGLFVAGVAEAGATATDDVLKPGQSLQVVIQAPQPLHLVSLALDAKGQSALAPRTAVLDDKGSLTLLREDAATLTTPGDYWLYVVGTESELKVERATALLDGSQTDVLELAKAAEAAGLSFRAARFTIPAKK